jgi:alkylation response protein AidB-like acyl-CoA dehydrogenase
LPTSPPAHVKARHDGIYARDKSIRTEPFGDKAGYYVDEPNAVDNGYWHRGYLNAFSATIGGGTSQIQRNIIAEHAMGLPKTR